MKQVPMYIKNVANSIKYSGQEFLRQQMPTTVDFFESNSDVLKAVTTDLRNYKNVYKQAKKWWSASNVANDIKTLKENAINDLKTGNFYNKARAEKDAFAQSGWEDVLGGFEEEMTSALNDYNNTSKAQEATTQSVINNTAATVNVMSAVGTTVSGAIGDSANYIVQSQNEIASQTMVNDYKMFNVVNNVLTDMATNVRGIYDYTNQMINFYNDSRKNELQLSNKMDQLVALIKETTEMKRNEYNEYNKSKEQKYYTGDHENFLSPGGSFNIKNYFETVQKRIKKEFENSGMSNGMMGENINPIQMLASNPLGFVSNALFNKGVSKELRQSMTELDKTMSGFFKSSMLKLSSSLRKKGEESDGFNLINRIFGIDTSDPGKMKTNLYVKGAVPWSGIAERALTEVLPTYARKILAAITGQEEMIYDYNSGKFNKITEVKKAYDKAIDNSYSDVDDMKRKVKDSINNFTFSNELQKQMEEDINKLFKHIVDTGMFYNPNKITNDDLRDSGLYLSGGDKSFQLINSAFKATGRQDWNQFNSDVLSAINRRHNDISNISANSRNTGFTAMDNGFQSQFDSETGKPNAIAGIMVKDKYGKSVTEYMRDIREILLDGIRVFPTKYNPNDMTDTGSIETRMKKYTEDIQSITKIASNDYNKSQAELKNQAEELGKKGGVNNVISSLSDINLSPTAQEEYFKRMMKNKPEEKKEDNTNPIVKQANSALARIYDTGKEIASVPGKVVKGILDSVNDNLLFFLYGSKDGDDKSLFNNILNKLNEFGNKIVNIVDEKAVKPLNNLLFNEQTGIITKLNNNIRNITDNIKDKLFNKETGIFTKVSKSFNEVMNGDGKDKKGLKTYIKDGISDMSNGFMNVLVGREYVSKITGEKIPAREETMWSITKNAFSSVSNYAKDLFKNNLTATNIKESISNGINKKTATISRVLFGTEEESMSPKEFFTKNISPRMPKSMIGALGGFGLALVSPLGIVGGTMMGAATGFLSNSSKFKDVLFGEAGSNNRIKADKIMDNINKALPRMGVGALSGAALALVSPLGIVGGTLLGSTMGYLSTSDKFKEFIFGNGDDKKGIIDRKYYEAFKEKLPGGALGASVGLLGSMFLPGGPVGGALMGLTLGIAGQSNMIKTYLFGDENPETGKRSGGLFGKMKLYMMTEIMYPLKTFAKDVSSKGLYFLRKELVNPILDAIDPIKKELSLIKDRIVERMKEAKDAIVDRFTNIVIKPFGSTMNKYILDPVKKTFKNLFGGMFSAIKNIITAPSKIINTFGNNLMKKHEAMGVADYKDEWQKKKTARDNKAEEAFQSSQRKIKAEKYNNQMLSKLMRDKKYDPNDPVVQKAMGWMQIGVSDNIKAMASDTNKNTTILDRISNLFSDFKKSWEQRNNIKSSKNKNINNNDISNNINESPQSPNSNNSGDNENLAINTNKPNEIKISNNINNNSKSNPIVNDNLTNIEKPTDIKPIGTNFNTPKTNIDDINRNLNTLITTIKTDDERAMNNNTSSDNNSINSKSVSKNIASIANNIDGQLNGVGYNTELIANILVDQFGMPSMMPKGIRAFGHKINSIFKKPKEFLSGVFGFITKPIMGIINTIKEIPKTIINAGTEVVKGTLGLIGEVGKAALNTISTVAKAIPGILDIIGTIVKGAVDATVNVFKAIPSVISTFGTVIKETSKVLGSMGVELVKGFGQGLIYATKSIGQLTVGVTKLAAEAIPALFKTVAGAASMIGTGIKSLFGGVAGKFGKKKSKTKAEGGAIDTIKLIKKVDEISVVNTVKVVEKISDARLYESLTNITTAIHGLRTGTDDLPISDNQVKNAVEGASDKAGNQIKNNITDITDKIKKANQKKKKQNNEINQVLNNVDMPQSNVIQFPGAANTGNKQVDLFKNKEKIQTVAKEQAIRNKLSLSADKFTISTGKIISRVFKKGGILSMIGDFLLTALPMVMGFFKNLKSKVLSIGKKILDYFLDKFGLKFPNLGKIKLPTSGGSTNVSGTKLGGGNNSTKALPSTDKISIDKELQSDVKDIVKDKMVNYGKESTDDILEVGGKKLLQNNADDILEVGGKKLLQNNADDILEVGGKKLLTGGVKSAAMNEAENIVKTSASKYAKDQIIDNVAFKVMDETGEKIASSGLKSTVKRGATYALNTVKTSGAGIIEKVLNSAAVKSILSKIGGSGIGKSLGKLAKWVSQKVAKGGSALLAKISAKWTALTASGALSAGAIPAIWYSATVINGMSATNRMFKLDQNYKPSLLMRAIAGFSAFVSDALTMGFIPADTIALFLGNILLSDEENEKIKASQSKLESNYNNYVTQTGKDISFDEYNSDVANASLATKAWNGIKNGAKPVWDTVKKGVTEKSPIAAFNDDYIRKSMGIGENEKIGLDDRLSMGTAGALSWMTMGMIDSSKIAPKIKTGIEAVEKTWDKVKDVAMNNTPLVAFNDNAIREQLGLDENVPITAQDRLSAGTGSIISTLSLGLIKKENATKAVYGAISTVKSGWNKVTTKAKDYIMNNTLFSAFNDDKVRETLGLSKDDPITSDDRLSIATGSVLSTMSFGLIKKENASKVISGGIGKLKDTWQYVSDKFQKIKEALPKAFEKFNKKMGEYLHLTDEDGNTIGVTDYVKDKTSKTVTTAKKGLQFLQQGATNLFNKFTSGFQSTANNDIAKRNASVEKNAGGDDTSGSTTSSSATKVNNAVYFSQNEQPWAGVDYGYGKNISQAGCGPTSAAMLLSSVTGQYITPKDTAQFSLSNGFRVQGNGTSWGFFKSLGDKYGVGINQTQDFNAVSNALAQGYPVILSGKGAPPFTKGGHYVMGVGRTSDGKIIINDPVSKDRSKAYDPSLIQSETAQAWISDKQLKDGPVTASADAANVAGSVSGSSDSGTSISTGNPITDALSQLGNITQSYIGTVIGGKSWDESMLESNTSPSTDGSSDSSSITAQGTDGYSKGTSKIADSVLALRPKIAQYANKYGISNTTDYIMAQLMQESGGRSDILAKDPMQSAESHGLAHGTNIGQDKSIDWGVELFSQNYKKSNGSIPLTLQSYNFGPGFIDYVKKNGGTMTQDLVNRFSSEQAAKYGWSNYGDKNYVQNVMRYYQGGGSGNENKPSLFGNANLPEFGGNGEDNSNVITEIKSAIDSSEFIFKNYKNTNDEINNTLTAHNMIKEQGLDGSKIDTIIELLKSIDSNTKEIADETKSNGEKLGVIDKNGSNGDTNLTQINQNNSSNNQSNSSTDPFTQLAKNSSSNKVSKAYELARQVAKGRKN